MDPRVTDNRHLNTNISYSEVFLFTTQIAAILLVILVSLVNLTFEWGNQNLWTLMLTASLGYIMPNPKMDILKSVMKGNKEDDVIEA